MRRWLDYLTFILAVVLFIILVGGGILFNQNAPCGWLTWEPVKDIPARCLAVK